MYALFNFDQTSTLYALIRDCKLIYFLDFCQIFRPNLEFWSKFHHLRLFGPVRLFGRLEYVVSKVFMQFMFHFSYKLGTRAFGLILLKLGYVLQIRICSMKFGRKFRKFTLHCCLDLTWLPQDWKNNFNLKSSSIAFFWYTVNTL